MTDPQKTGSDDQPLVQSAEPAPHTHPSSHPSEPTATGSPPPAPAAETQVMVGSTLGPYRLLAMLGQGGMGAVYKAQHQHLDKTVAIKVLPQHITKHPDSIARFKREMKAVGKINHPNIVQAHDAGEINGTHYLAMEYVEGSDLVELIRTRGPLPFVQACKAIRQAALALAAAHGVGLIHRDIKPANLLLDKRGQIKLLDLGLALLGDEAGGSTELTSAGQTFGTPDYMAPEQWEDAHASDARTDLYALGCTLFYLLVGHAPFGTDKYKTAMSKMKAHAIESIPEFPADCQEVPDGVRKIYKKLLAKSPAERFQTAAELAEALAPFSSSKKSPDKASGGRQSPDSSVRHGVNADAITPCDEPHEPIVAPRDEQSAANAADTRRSESDPVTPVIQAETFRTIQVPTDPDPGSRSRETSEATSQVHLNSHASSYATPPPRHPTRKLLYTAGAAAFLILCGVIIITITNKDGTQTKIEVPGDSKIEISTDTRRMAAPGRPNGQVAGVGKTAEGGHPTGEQASWHGWPANAPKPAIAPFNADQAEQHQKAWAQYLNVPVEYTNTIGMKFRLVPPGEFTMGSTPEEIQEALKVVSKDKTWPEYVRSGGPQHKVVLTRPIYLGIHEVTQAEYQKVTGNNPSHFAPTGNGKDAVARLDTLTHPVENVSWNDAAELCTTLSVKEKLKPFKSELGTDRITATDGISYRLPTEAEWEFACRAGTTSRYSNGDKDEDLVRVGWIPKNSSGHTHAVGELKASPFGLFDIHGNVWEWVLDRWDPTYYEQFQQSPAIDPSGPTVAGTARVLRGGGWDPYVAYCRSSFRVSHSQADRGGWMGIRVALPVDAVRQALKVTGPAIPQPRKAAPEISNPKSQIPNSSDPIDFAAERKAAERLLKLKKATGSLQNGGTTWPLKEPLPAEEFYISHVSLVGVDLTDEELGVLAGCRGLNRLDLGGNSKLTSNGFKAIGQLPALRSLDLSFNSGLKDGLQFLSLYPNLNYLCLYMVDDTKGTLTQSLPRLTQLKELTTPHWEGQGKSLETIVRQCPKLTFLWIGGNSDSLTSLSRLRELRCLHCWGSLLTDAGIEALAKLPDFNELMVDGPDRESMQRLKNLDGNLRDLTIRFQGVPSVELEKWISITELRVRAKITFTS